MRAEALAASAGRQLGLPISIAEQGAADLNTTTVVSTRECLINVRLSVQYELR
jgi:hypothetical protein